MQVHTYVPSQQGQRMQLIKQYAVHLPWAHMTSHLCVLGCQQCTWKWFLFMCWFTSMWCVHELFAQTVHWHMFLWLLIVFLVLTSIQCRMQVGT